jgi:hypothetical protein
MKALGYDMIVTAVEVPAALSVEFRGVCNKVLTGVTGKYFVAAELSRCGNIASITLRNTKGVDILCSNADASIAAGYFLKRESTITPIRVVGGRPLRCAFRTQVGHRKRSEKGHLAISPLIRVEVYQFGCSGIRFRLLIVVK